MFGFLEKLALFPVKLFVELTMFACGRTSFSSSSSSSLPSLRRMAASTWLGLAVLTLTIEGLGGHQCKFELGQYQERRIAAIKGQILSKLGLTTPPTDDGPDVVPKDVLDIYNQTAMLLDEKYQQEREHCAALSGASDDYFAQVPLLYTIDLTYSKDNYARSRMDMSEFFKFDLANFPSDSGSDELSEAELRLYQVPNTMKTTEQQIDLFQLLPNANSSGEPVRRYLTSWTVSTTRQGWLSHDVTHVVRQWIVDPDSNLGFEINLNCGDFQPPPPEHTLHVLFADPRGTYPSMTNGRGDQNPSPQYHETRYAPRVVLMAPANHTRNNEVEAGRRRRSASSRNDAVCDDSTPNCCLRPLTINFRRDLKWNWIRQPRSYTPNYCAGSCPFILSADTNFASVLSLYKRLNPDASPSPCCSPSSFKPLTIMYYNKGRPEVRHLNNMIIEKCRCS